MKKLNHILIVLTLIVPFMIQASFMADILDDIGLTIKSGNAKELVKFFDTNVEITLLDEEGTYSKAQAEQVIKDFFAVYEPASFVLVHRGSSGEGSQYGIGSLTTTKGQKFRTYFFVKKLGEKSLIQELRFEEE